MTIHGGRSVHDSLLFTRVIAHLLPVSAFLDHTVHYCGSRNHHQGLISLTEKLFFMIDDEQDCRLIHIHIMCVSIEGVAIDGAVLQQ